MISKFESKEIEESEDESESESESERMSSWKIVNLGFIGFSQNLSLKFGVGTLRDIQCHK